MYTMMDGVDQLISVRMKNLREVRQWSLSRLADTSGVSKAMLSRIERTEASPTATILSRIASAFDMTLAELLTFDDQPSVRCARLDDQPQWQDPVSGYLRRQVLVSPQVPVELVEVTMPPGKSATFGADAYVGRHHAIWVLSGVLTLSEGSAEWTLQAGDRLLLGEPAQVTYANRTPRTCKYLVCVMRT